MKRTILYLDDERSCLDVFQEMFAGDYEVRTAATADEARRALGERMADIVISDQKMPDIEGTEFLREIASSHPESYRVMLTGTAMVGDLIHEISNGTVNLFVPKPWSEAAMRGVLERASAWLEVRQKEHDAPDRQEE